MKLLITGAAGLVGGAIARLAAEHGHEVVRTWHSVPPAPLGNALDVQCDLGDPSSVSRLPQVVDGVVHAAARIPGRLSDAAAAQANRRADDAVLQHYSEAGFAGRWVYLSSVSLEHAELRVSSQYAEEKAKTEELTARAFPGRSRSLRISSPYGDEMRHVNVLRLFARAALADEPITLLGSGERTQDFVHVDDVAAAALAAIESPGGDPLVIASGQPVSMAKLAELMVLLTDATSPITHTGLPDPQDGFRADYDLQPALDALGWAPAIRLDAGLLSMLRAM